MLRTDPISLFEEIAPSEELRDGVIASSSRMVRDYAGNYYRKDWSTEAPVPENEFFQWFQLASAKIVYDNPKVIATSRASGRSGAIALALEHGLNETSRQSALWKTLRRVFYDTAFSYGVVLTGYEPSAGFDGHESEDDRGGLPVPYLPVSRRIAPHRWFCDHDCDDYEEARFAGHVWRKDHEDLLADPRYDSAAVAELAADAGLEKWYGEKRTWGGKLRPEANRREIVGYEVWVPESQLGDDPDAHGAIYTLGVAQNGGGDVVEPRWIRAPRPFVGPRRGPYVLFGYNLVPGSPYPLSPFAATYEQVLELNAHATSAARGAARYKRFIGFDPENGAAGEAVKNVRDGAVVPIPGLGQKAWQEMEVGGITDPQTKYLMMLRERRDRQTGLSENARGNIDSGATASAVMDAASQRDARMAMLKRMFGEATREVLDSRGFYLFTMPDAVFPLPEEVARQFASPEVLATLMEAEAGRPMPNPAVYDRLAAAATAQQTPQAAFAGGPAESPITPLVDGRGELMLMVSPNAEGVRYEDLDLEIDAYSMERTDEVLQQKRTIDLTDRILAMVPQMAAAPQVNWADWIDWLGDAVNVRELSKKLLVQPGGAAGMPMAGATGMTPGAIDPATGTPGTAPMDARGGAATATPGMAPAGVGAGMMQPAQEQGAEYAQGVAA